MNQFEEDYIDLGELFRALVHRLWIIVIATVVAGAVGLSVSMFAITPLYSASAMMIVNAGDRGYDYISSDQLRSAASLVDTYSVIITSDTVVNQVKDNLAMQESFDSQIRKIAVAAVNETQIMKITVTGTSSIAALRVCEEITNVVPDVLVEVVEAGSVKLVSKAATTGEKVSPSIRKNTLMGCAAGFLLSAGLITMFFLLDNKIKTEADIEHIELSVLGVIPSYEREGE